jgi:hypothetical protein
VIAPVAPDSGEPGRIVEEHQWTYRDIMMVFIYGNMAHANSNYRQIYMRWKGNPWFAFVENMFDSIITNGIRAVVIACRITERELANQEQ